MSYECHTEHLLTVLQVSAMVDYVDSQVEPIVRSNTLSSRPPCALCSALGCSQCSHTYHRCLSCVSEMPNGPILMAPLISVMVSIVKGQSQMPFC